MDVFQPPPLYPPLVSRPLNLEKNDDYESLLKIKTNFRSLMKDSFYHIEKRASSSDNTEFDSTIQRYSDRYSKSKKNDLNKWKPDWSRLPKELKHFYEKEEKSLRLKRKCVAPKLVKKKILRELDIDKLVEIIARDEDIEENEENDESEEKEKKPKGSDDEEENQEELENAEEEDVEEENDYIDTYFENGENYEDDNGGGDDEGPVY